MKFSSNIELLIKGLEELEVIFNLDDDNARKSRIREYVAKSYREEDIDVRLKYFYEWANGNAKIKFNPEILSETILDHDKKKSQIIYKTMNEVTVTNDNQTTILKSIFPGYWYKKGMKTYVTVVFKIIIENGKTVYEEEVLSNYKEQIMGTQQWADLYLNQNVDVDKYLEFIRGENLID